MNRKNAIPSTEAFENMLLKAGLKATRQRMAVHEVMRTLVHASAEDVSSALKESGGSPVSTASVYNILSQLTEKGIYSARMTAGSKMYFDVRRNNHFHLYDTEGNTFKDIENEELSKMLKFYLGRKRFKGYKIDGFDLQILCHPTKKNKKLF